MENTNNATLTDYTVNDTIEDTIQTLRFIPSRNNNYLASCGWDAKLRIWDVKYQVGGMNNNSAQISTSLIYTTSLNDPLMSLAWQGDSTTIFTGSGDGTVFCVDLQNNRSQALGKHEIGCKELIWVAQANMLISGGWDGKVNFWDLRQQNPCAQMETGKVLTMSLTNNLLVLGTNDRTVSYYNVTKLFSGYNNPEASFESHLRYQTRRIATFTDGDGYAIGSIEGRVAIKYVDLNRAPEISPDTKTMTTKDDFAFRCHRAGENFTEVYAVNDIAFNPAYGTFCTCGGDGTWIIWDKDSRSRLRQGYHNNKSPITAIDYSGNGDLLAYASGYDWAKGVAYEGSFSPKLNIHYCPDADKKKKQKK